MSFFCPYTTCPILQNERLQRPFALLRTDDIEKPQTNADCIRSMTDEELVKMMEDHGCCPIGACPYSEVGAYITRQDCEMCWLEWLKSPAEVDK